MNQIIRVSYKPCTASTMAWLVERPGPSTISRRLMPSTLFIKLVIRHKRSRAEGARKVECQKMMLEYQSRSICSCGFKDLLPCCFCQTEIAIFLCFSYFIQLSIESGYIYFKHTRPNSLLFYSSVVACLTFLFQFTTIFHLKSLIVSEIVVPL